MAEQPIASSAGVDRSPNFSVVIPSRRRPKQLAACLEALARLDYDPARYEVIVVSDGEETIAPSVARPAARELRMIHVVQPHSGAAAARNNGAARARGSFLAFVDDDCAPAPNWLACLERRLAEEPDAVVGGRTVNALGGNLYSSVSQLVVDALYAHYNADSERARFFATSNMALATEQFRSLGGFDSSFPFAAGEDREFTDRCVQREVRLRYAPEAVVMHYHALTLRSFVAQHFTYGRGTAHFHRARVSRGRGRPRIEPRFYGLLARLSLTLGSVRAAPAAALAVLTQAAYATGFAYEELRLSFTDRKRHPGNG